MKVSMGVAALLMAVSVLLSRFMGLFRDKVISWQFGTGADADIYFTAFVIPDFINYLLAGGYLSITLIPFLAKKFEAEKEVPFDGKKINTLDSWRFFSTVFSWAGLAITSLTLIAFIFAPSIARWVAPGFSAEHLDRLAEFLRIILFGQVFFILGACFSSILYVRKEFLVPALMPLIYNGFILLFGVLYPYLGFGNGMEGFCYGVLFGSFVGAFLLPWYAVRRKELHFKFSLKHKDFKKFLIVALPLMLGQSVVVLDEQFVRIFGSLAGDGAVSLLNYSRRIMLVPVGVVAQAAALASFPYLSSLYAKQEYAEFDNTLLRSLKSSLILIIPITAYMILQSGNIIGFIFEGGIFTQTETKLATPLLQLMLFSVPFWAIQQIIGRAFYAKQDTITPAIIGSIATFAVVPLYIYFVPIYGVEVVALMTSVSVIFYTLILMGVWYRRNKSRVFIETIKTVARSILIILPSTFFAWYIGMKSHIIFEEYNLLFRQFVEIGVSGFVFLVMWLFLLHKLQKNDFDILLAPFMRKLDRFIKKGKNNEA